MDHKTNNQNGKFYEEDNVKVAPLVKGLTGLLLITIFSMIVVWFFATGPAKYADYHGFYTVKEDGFSSRQAPSGVSAPRLQVDEIEDLKKYKKTQSDLLNQYSWVDKNAKVVRIPIEQAMKRILEKGSLNR